LNLSNGVVWELRTKNSSDQWVCRVLHPACPLHTCPLILFQEFSESEILEHTMLDSHLLSSIDEYQAEVRLTYYIEHVTKNLTPEQKRSVLLAVKQNIETRLSHLP